MFSIIKLLLSISMTCSSISFISSINNQQNDELNALNTKEFINNNPTWGKVKTNGKLNLNNQSIELLVTYENPKETLERFKTEYDEELESIRIKEGYKEINDTNYQQYYDYFLSNPDTIGIDKINEVYAFFDIYENNDKNNQLINKINRYNLDKNDDLLMGIASLSPCYNPSITKMLENVLEISSTKGVTRLNDINVSKATTYAKQYAVNRNHAEFLDFGVNNDCTNFVSQIALRGGLNTTSVWKLYTTTWVNANLFANYWGKKYSARVWSGLTLQAGDFIACDYGGDGVIDHLAYVTQKVSTHVVYIAQHSTDYHKRSDQTSWSVYSNNRILYELGR